MALEWPMHSKWPTVSQAVSLLILSTHQDVPVDTRGGPHAGREPIICTEMPWLIVSHHTPD